MRGRLGAPRSSGRSTALSETICVDVSETKAEVLEESTEHGGRTFPTQDVKCRRYALGRDDWHRSAHPSLSPGRLASTPTKKGEERPDVSGGRTKLDLLPVSSYVLGPFVRAVVEVEDRVWSRSEYRES